MIAALERLAFDEVVKKVELAFRLNRFPMTAQLSRTDLMEVTSSYLLTEMLELTENVTQHVTDKKGFKDSYPNWGITYEFLVDVVSSEIFGKRASANPFAQAQTFTFEDASRMAE